MRPPNHSAMSLGLILLIIGSGTSNGRAARQEAGHLLNVAENEEKTQVRAIDGPGGFTKVGKGTLVLPLQNRFSGKVRVMEGTLKIVQGGILFGEEASSEIDAVGVGPGATLELEHWFPRNDLSLGILPDDPERIVVNGGRLRVTGITGSGRGLTIKEQGAIFDAAKGANWLMHDLKNPKEFIFVGEAPLTFTGEGTGRFDKIVPHAGKIMKTGSSTWIIGSPVFHSGDVEVREGTLEMTYPVLPDGKVVKIESGAKLILRFADGDAVKSLVLGEKRMPPGTYTAKTHPDFLAGPGSIIVGGPAVTAPPPLTYYLNEGWKEWDPQRLSRIRDSIEYAVNLYNQGGYFPFNVRIENNLEVKTADANMYSKNIRFGHSISGPTALHEIGHIMGVGQHWKWKEMKKDGKYIGEHADALVKQVDGPDAEVGLDKMHFWPYGLNYTREHGKINEVIHVRMLEAFRRDMDIY